MYVAEAFFRENVTVLVVETISGVYTIELHANSDSMKDSLFSVHQERNHKYNWQ